ncbi:MAG: helix-turn-helix transcriptional regulator [Bacteroidota bacterium]
MNIDLKKIRTENGGLTQSELAERLGIKLRTIQNYENGAPIPKSMEKLITYEFNLTAELPGDKPRTKADVFKLLDELSERMSARDAKVLATIKEEFEKQDAEKDEFREKYYKTLERLDKLKSYMIKSLDIPEKYLD